MATPLPRRQLQEPPVCAIPDLVTSFENRLSVSFLVQLFDDVLCPVVDPP